MFFGFSLTDPGVNCPAELDALYEVYTEQSAGLMSSTEESKQTSLNNLQKVSLAFQSNQKNSVAAFLFSYTLKKRQETPEMDKEYPS